MKPEHRNRKSTPHVVRHVVAAAPDDGTPVRFRYALHDRFRAGPLSFVSVIIANLIPVSGVFFFHWDVTMILVLYWLENAVIGLFLAAKIALVRHDLTLLRRISQGISGVFPYAVFTVIHLLFVVALCTAFQAQAEGKTTFRLHFEQTIPVLKIFVSPQVLATLALMAGHQFFSLVYDFVGRGEFRRTTAEALVKSTALRVVPLHMCIVFGVTVSPAFDLPKGFLLVLMAAKTITDLAGHTLDRARGADPVPEFPLTRATRGRVFQRVHRTLLYISIFAVLAVVISWTAGLRDWGILHVIPLTIACGICGVLAASLPTPGDDTARFFVGALSLLRFPALFVSCAGVLLSPAGFANLSTFRALGSPDSRVTDGLVTHMRERQERSGHYYHVTFSFTPAGAPPQANTRRYEAGDDLRFENASGVTIGGPVRVRYLQSNPAVARLDSEFAFGRSQMYKLTYSGLALVLNGVIIVLQIARSSRVGWRCRTN